MSAPAARPLADGYHDVPPGKLAAVVTSLEMRRRAEPRPEVAGANWTLRREPKPTAEGYRALFRRMGADWLWFSRLGMAEDELVGTIADPDVEIHLLGAGEHDEGFVELDFRIPGECEIAFFAIGAALRGRGAGRWLMNRTIALAWSRPIERLWVHTCTLDHPDALGFYQRSGFTAYRRQVEIADDPRLSGGLPLEAARTIPRL